MKPLNSRTSSWRLLAAASLLGVLGALQDTAAQPGRPGGISGIPRPPIGAGGGGIGGVPRPPIGAGGGVGGVGGVGGFPRNPGNVGGLGGGNFGQMGGNVAGAAGVAGGQPPGVGGGGGMIFTYNCSRCKAQVGEFDASCPSCGARFSNRAGGGWNEGPSRLRFDSSGAPSPVSSGSKEEGGLSIGVILGVAGVGIVLLIGVVALALFSGSAPKRKKKRPVRDNDDYDD